MPTAAHHPTGPPAIFNFETHPIDVYPDADGDPWFVGRQVCAVLGLHPDRALARLDDDEKGLRITQTPGGPQNLTVLNEAGLFNLVLRSRKPDTKRFRRWVTHEVLPAIRKTGSYTAPTAQPTRDVPEHILLRERRLSDRETRLAKQTTYRAMLRVAEHAREVGEVSDAALLTVEVRAAEFVTGMDLGLLLPAAPASDDGALWLSPTDMAEALDVSTQRIGLTLTAIGARSDKTRSMAVLDKSRSSAKTVTGYRYRPDVLEDVRAKLVADGHIGTDGGAL